MRAKQLKDISQPQQERLAFLEYRLLFLGFVNRADLVERFGLKESAASRDIALYRDLAPDNISYNTVLRCYEYAPAFAPLFDYLPRQVLVALSLGFGDDFVADAMVSLPSELPVQLDLPSLPVLAPVTRALARKQAVTVTYRSLGSGTSERCLIPVALVDNGLRWHLRGYDTGKQRYADFVLNRIELAQDTSVEGWDVDQIRKEDTDWQHQVELCLVPHPALDHPEVIDFEYKMQKGELSLTTRAALAGYLLRRWNVDCSSDHCLQGPEYHLWLRNADDLEGIPNLAIAPGFQPAAPQQQTS